MEPDEETPLVEQTSQPSRWQALTGFLTPRGAFETLMEDEITYQPWKLAAWKSLFAVKGSIWVSRSLWLTMLKLLGLTFLTVIVVVLVMPKPHKLKVSRFIEISKFLTLFVGLLLGFFITSSLVRWHECMQGFLELGDAIRNLQMQLCALDAPGESIDMCMRYGLLSGALLRIQLSVEMLPKDERGSKRDMMWRELLSTSNEQLGYQVKFTPQEYQIVKTIRDPAGLMWTWVASIVARMAQDGAIPPMASPTYGRIMNLAQDAHDGIRHVRSSISVQAPFVYVHTLVSLVHINNMLNGFCLGMVIGSVCSEILMRHRGHFIHDTEVPQDGTDRDVQFVSITTFICLIGPFLYQAIMEIGLALAQPFASQYAKVPIERLQGMLEEDLADGKILASNTPHWDRPSWRESVAKK
mmetsp:Transcript_11289/g.21265  ORF Transcript_11289/g.21265 Transcript_11289/m.21265 type:complete len:411 (+) Transcript_11289:112-1344(+)